MALRIRVNGDIFCAAITKEEKGDVYIDDSVHYVLSALNKVLVTRSEPEHTETGGQWYWINNIPENVEIDSFYMEKSNGRN